ncbi:MAG: LptE family protein [Bacteroidota bacterium]|nr:LptE family protein [Bacteroidota bacterium]
MKIVLKYITVFFVLSSCALPHYSLKPAGKGAQKEIPAKSIQIDFFENTSPLSSAIVSSLFTESLRDLMQAQTSLDLVANNGDVIFSGAIKEYKISPVNIQAGTETAAQNRLTMSVFIDQYFTTVDSVGLSNHKVSAFVDYNSSEDFNSIEESLIENLNYQLTQDIFDKAFGGEW